MPKTKERSQAPAQELPKRQTFKVKLTQFELVHLRDLFNVRLPPDLTQTISQALALAEERSLVEARLWSKLVEVMREAAVPLDDDAPDFVCAASAPPPVSVFRLAQEPAEAGPPQPDSNSPFDFPASPGGDTDDGGGTHCDKCNELHAPQQVKCVPPRKKKGA